MRSSFVVVALLTAGCGAGQKTVSVSRVGRSEVVPVGYVTLGSAHAECRRGPRFGALHGAVATSFQCNRELVERALREQAAARGGTVLAELRCHATSSKLGCSATIARPSGDGAEALPLPPEAERAALPVSVASRIAIDLEPRVEGFARRARSADDVAESPLLPVGRRELGTLRARCNADDCDAAQVREGLRAAAGGLGASDLVGVRCFALDGDVECVATLAATERDPETDPLAH